MRAEKKDLRGIIVYRSVVKGTLRIRCVVVDGREMDRKESIIQLAV